MNLLPKNIQDSLNESYTLTSAHIKFFQDNRYIKLKHVFDSQTLAFYNDVISKKVNELNFITTALSDRGTYGKAFLQIFNLWREDDTIKELIFSKRLGEIATALMQVEGVRIYHDQALFKEAGGGITPWHADQYYWPLATDKTITAWIPLQEIPLPMGALEFCAGSHQIVEGRELEIGDQSELLMQERLRVTDFAHIKEPFDLGEISFHSGWVFHRAGPNTTKQLRKVMTIIYIDKSMLLKNPENQNQQVDWETWCPGAEPGKEIDTPLNPIVFEKQPT